MKNHSMLLVAATAAFLCTSPVFAQAHDHSQMQHGSMDHGMSCPHHQATETAVSQALTLLDEAKGQTGDQEKATLDQARQQLAEAQQHMSACQEMCKSKMGGDHAGMMDHSMHQAADGTEKPAAQPAQVTDPVCGMKIDVKSAAGKSVYAGKTYYFCSKDEKALFDKEPEKYLKKQ